MTGWHTLTELQAGAGDAVEHIYGSRYQIDRYDAHGRFWPSEGPALMNARVWRIVERASDREAREHAEQIAGTEAG